MGGETEHSHPVSHIASADPHGPPLLDALLFGLGELDGQGDLHVGGDHGPQFTDVPLDASLSDRYTRIPRSLIDMKRASLDRHPGDPKAMRATRAQGPVEDANSRIPSCNFDGKKPRPSGVTHGNRLRNLNTTPGHRNHIQPGKRPRITLTPTNPAQVFAENAVVVPIAGWAPAIARSGGPLE